MALAQPREETVSAAPSLPQKRLWTREEYHRAAELGLFRPDERLELIEGEVYVKVSPQDDPHAWHIALAAEAFRDAFGAGFHVREEKPLVLPDQTEPEPDIVVVRGPLRASRRHPTPQEAVLVMEVSDSTLEFDQGRKAALYAQVGIPDYWVLDLRHRVLEVRRDPAQIGDRYDYRTLQTFMPGMEVSPLAMPQAVIRVDDLLPPEADEQGGA